MVDITVDYLIYFSWYLPELFCLLIAFILAPFCISSSIILLLSSPATYISGVCKLSQSTAFTFAPFSMSAWQTISNPMKMKRLVKVKVYQNIAFDVWKSRSCLYLFRPHTSERFCHSFPQNWHRLHFQWAIPQLSHILSMKMQCFQTVFFPMVNKWK